jgi:hypothetical protein
MAKWRWDRRAEKEFREATTGPPAARALFGEVAYALERLRSGQSGLAFRTRGRVRVLPIHSEAPWSLLFARYQTGQLVGLHFAKGSWPNLPNGAIDLAESRLESPEL